VRRDMAMVVTDCVLAAQMTGVGARVNVERQMVRPDACRRRRVRRRAICGGVLAVPAWRLPPLGGVL
jgi:hypothetical protein